MSFKSRQAFADRNGAPAPSSSLLRAQAVAKLKKAKALIDEAMALQAQADEMDAAKLPGSKPISL